MTVKELKFFLNTYNDEDEVLVKLLGLAYPITLDGMAPMPVFIPVLTKINTWDATSLYKQN